MWLEIQHHLVIGVHSERSDNGAEWVEYQGESPVHPGDGWVDGQVVPMSVDVDPQAERRRAAARHIQREYPLWRQLNVLRSGDPDEIARMGTFIDACRNWSNQPDTQITQLTDLHP